jgi:hypothetical protein
MHCDGAITPSFTLRFVALSVQADTFPPLGRHELRGIVGLRPSDPRRKVATLPSK